MTDPSRKELKVSGVFHRNNQVGSISQKSSRQPLVGGGGETDPKYWRLRTSPSATLEF